MNNRNIIGTKVGREKCNKNEMVWEGTKRSEMELDWKKRNIDGTELGRKKRNRTKLIGKKQNGWKWNLIDKTEHSRNGNGQEEAEQKKMDCNGTK